MRADIGDYFCKVTDTAGEISLSPHSSVYGEKYGEGIISRE